MLFVIYLCDKNITN